MSARTWPVPRRLLLRNCAALVCAALLAGCGGGRHDAGTLPSASGQSASGAYQGAAPATFVFSFPKQTSSSTKRAPKYLSSATASLSLQVTDTKNHGDASDIYANVPAALKVVQYFNPANLTGNGTTPGQCGTDPSNAGNYQCTAVFQVPVGDDTVTIASWSGSSGGGNLLSQQITTVWVKQGVANTYAIVLDANTGSITVTPPPTGVTLSGTGCPGSTITGSSDLSASCMATFADGSAKNFTVSVADPHGTTIPSTAPGAPVLSASSSNTAKFTASISGSTLTITPVCGGTATITVTSTPANIASDGLAAVALVFTVTQVPAAAQRVYVANTGNNTVTVYAANPSGSVTCPPLATIGGGSTGISGPQGVALDSSGKVYVTNGNNTVTVYAANPSGNVTSAPLATIGGGSTGISSPDGVAFDGSGQIYVANFGNSTVTVYAANPSGNVTNAPLATIGGGSAGINGPTGVALDSSGKVYVANQFTHNVTVYAANPSGNVTSAPLATIGGGSTGVNGPQGVALDSSGKVYVTNGNNTVTVYAANPSGSVTSAPLATIGGGSTGISCPKGVAFDSSGQIYVANSCNSTVTVYAANPSGNVTSAPLATIGGGSTGISGPFGVAVH